MPMTRYPIADESSAAAAATIGRGVQQSFFETVENGEKEGAPSKEWMIPVTYGMHRSGLSSIATSANHLDARDGESRSDSSSERDLPDDQQQEDDNAGRLESSEYYQPTQYNWHQQDEGPEGEDESAASSSRSAAGDGGSCSGGRGDGDDESDRQQEPSLAAAAGGGDGSGDRQQQGRALKLELDQLRVLQDAHATSLQELLLEHEQVQNALRQKIDEQRQNVRLAQDHLDMLMKIDEIGAN